MKCGEIWDAKVPFTDDPSQGKFRPVVVVGWSAQGAGEDQVVLVVPVSSFGDGGQARNGDVPLTDFAALGLSKESWARARRLWGAHPGAMKRRARPGRLSDPDFSAILLEIQRLFQPLGGAK